LSWLAKYSTAISLAVLLALLVGYGIFEASIMSGSSEAQPNLQTEIARSLDQGVHFFDNLAAEFQNKSDQIYSVINDAIQTETSKMALHNRLEEYNIWGVTVFHDNDKWFWTGFDVSSPSDFQFLNSTSDTTTIVNFNGEDYTVVTADKLYQVSELPFSKDRPLQFADEPNLQNRYPIYFNFFGNTPQAASYRTLSTS
jgi:hypothetical protein